MQLGNGISERHVRNISNMAGEILMEIHEENIPRLKDAMNSYILQIDGTTDSEFSMVIVVRDAISGFTLYAEKCHSESFESVKDILLKVKEKFKIPSGAISDMRAGILEALELDFREEVDEQYDTEVLLHGLTCQFFKNYVGTELNIFPG